MGRTLVRGGVGVRAAAAVSLALVVSGVSACGSSPEAPPTDRVQRGTVSTQVSASGALAAVTSQNLGFQRGAQLKELYVKVGDVVTPGQVLAVLDDFNFRQTLDQQQAILDQQQALLDRLIAGVTVPNAERSLDQARTILEKTKKSVDAQIDAAEAAAHRARVRYAFDLKQLWKAKVALAECIDTAPPVAPVASEDASDGVDPAGDAGASSDPLEAPAANASGGTSSSSGGLLGSLGGAIPEQCAEQENAVTQAKSVAINSKTSWLTAKRQLDVVRAGGQVTIENARNGVISAQNNRDSAEADRPGTIEAQRALVDSAAAQVRLAQRDVDNTVLRAPVGGSVSAVTGTVGEFIGSGSPTTALAPGTNASIPGVGAAASSDAAGQASAGLSATRPGGGAFIVLNNVNTFQVVVPFEESDAARVAPNQRARMTFDAIPDLEREGTVLSLAPTGTNISGVTNYYATILLTESDPRLRGGLTAEAGVLTSQADNVLLVPNSAIIREGGRAFVNVPGPDGAPMRKQFEPGLVGDTHTEVRSGLSEGEQLIIPQPNPAPTPGGN